eukprot:g3771.t1
MSVNAQKAKVSQMQAQRKSMGEKLDWDDAAAVKTFNAFQNALKKEEQHLVTLQKEAKEGTWDFDGDF